MKQHKTLLTLLFIGVLMGAVDLAIIGPALPAIQAEFGAADRELAMLLNAYVMCQLIGTPLLAKLSDRYKILIGTNFDREDYAKQLSRARIVFNHCVRGELNLRVWETLAIGPLLFLDEANPPEYPHPMKVLSRMVMS